MSAQVAVLATAQTAVMSAPIEIAPPKRSGLLRYNPVTGPRMDPRTRRSIFYIGGGIVFAIVALVILSDLPSTPNLNNVLPTNTNTPTIR